jgi:rhodanese-related sulfurtransferase
MPIDEQLEVARSGLDRLGPLEAAAAVDAGALLIDIRPIHQRTADGEVPGALVIDRNVLEWRLDPESANRIPEITDHDQTVILFCDEGYASSIAAASLQAVGLRHATDLDGGYQAWCEAGLPVTPPVLGTLNRTESG